MSDSVLQDISNQAKISHVHANAVVVANIVEVVSSVIKNIATSDVSSALSEDGLSSDVLSNIVANRIKEHTINTGV